GTNSIDNAARVCHSPSTFALKQGLGVAATTCSYADLIGSDLVVFVGANVANNQPVMMKYLYYARNAGTRVVTINSYRERGVKQWVGVPRSLRGDAVAGAGWRPGGPRSGCLRHGLSRGPSPRARARRSIL